MPSTGPPGPLHAQSPVGDDLPPCSVRAVVLSTSLDITSFISPPMTRIPSGMSSNNFPISGRVMVWSLGGMYTEQRLIV